MMVVMMAVKTVDMTAIIMVMLTLITVESCFDADHQAPSSH